MSLILHVDSNSTPYDVIAQLPTPEATSTHKPVAHVVMIDLIRQIATEKGYQITREHFGLNKDGSKMFGVIDFSNTDATGNEYQYSIGFRNSHNKSLSFGIVAGGRVMVCDNLMFQGDWSLSRKHTSGINPENVVRAAFEMMPKSWQRLRVGIDKMKNQYVTLAEASQIILEAAKLHVIPAADAVKVFEEFQNPRHDAFKPLTKWSLYNAFTEINKLAPSMARSAKTLNGLAALFGLTDQDIESIEGDDSAEDQDGIGVDAETDTGTTDELNNPNQLNAAMQLEIRLDADVVPISSPDYEDDDEDYEDDDEDNDEDEDWF